ncbi:MAG: hypothetical protein HMLKMBBP_02643 [Planctomycetes bacterium]|nr:hypothetical protein [Planctomycetota bacterium]
MGLRRWYRHLSAYAAAKLRGDAAAALRERREIALLALDGDAERLSFERDGLRWTVAAVRHTITRNLYVRGAHPGAEVAALGAWLRAKGRLGPEHPWCADVGANVGAPTLFFARDLGRRVIAVEPVPATFELLRANVAANRLHDQVECVQAAVSEAAGSVRISVSAKDGQSEVGSGPGAVDVPSRPLDEFVASCGARPDQVSFVWSDTQGFEAHVVRSGRAVFAAGVPAFLELWPEALARHGGIDSFVAACASSFTGFIPKRDLLARGPAAAAQPVSGLAPFLASLPKQTDALFVS